MSNHLAVVAVLISSILTGCGADRSGILWDARPTIHHGIVLLSVVQPDTEWFGEIRAQDSMFVPIAHGRQAVAADDGRIVFIRRSQHGHHAIWLRETTGKENPITSGEYEDAWPVLISNNAIVFMRAHEFRNTSTFDQRWVDWDLYMSSPAGSTPVRVTNVHFKDFSGMSATADGQTIFIGARRSDEEERVYSFALKTRELQPVGQIGDSSPAAFGTDLVVVRRTGNRSSEGFYCSELMLISHGSSDQLTHLCSQLSAVSATAARDSLLFLADSDRNGTYDVMRLELGSRSIAKIDVNLR